MDPAEVARLVSEFKRSSKEDRKVVKISKVSTEAGKENLARSLVGKVFSNRAINRDTLRSQLPKILQTREAVDIEIVGDNRFVVVFGSVADRRHALEDGPWHFFQSFMLFREVEGLQNPIDVDFDTFAIWVQLHNLPLACMNPKVVEEIGSQIGIVDEVDVGEGGRCLGKYARVRVRLPLLKPLQQCLAVALDDDDTELFILLTYEKLPDFCHLCGIIGHVKRDCPETSVDKNNPPFGEWMKAKKESEVRKQRQYSDAPSRSGRNQNHHEEELGDPHIDKTSNPATEINKARKDAFNTNASSTKGEEKSSVPKGGGQQKDWKKRARESLGTAPEKKHKLNVPSSNSLQENREPLSSAAAAVQPRRTL